MQNKKFSQTFMFEVLRVNFWSTIGYQTLVEFFPYLSIVSYKTLEIRLLNDRYFVGTLDSSTYCHSILTRRSLGIGLLLLFWSFVWPAAVG